MFAAALLFLPSVEVLAAVAALMWHEGAHMLTMRLCGAEGCMIELTPFGGMAEVRSYEKLSPVRQALCAGAGMAASAAGYGMVQLLGEKGIFFHELAEMNLSLMFVNCLPLWPLDGARVAVAAASYFGWEHGVRKMLSALAWVMGIVLVLLGLYGAWRGWINPSLLLAGPYLCYASSQGMVAQRVRQFAYAGTEGKLPGVLPVSVSACMQGVERACAAALLGRAERSRWHVLLVMEPDGGRIGRVMTEQEMLEDIVGPEP